MVAFCYSRLLILHLPTADCTSHACVEQTHFPKVAIFAKNNIAVVFADMAIAVRLCYDVLTGVDITIEDGEDQVSTEEAFAFAKDCLPSAVDIICDNCWVGKFKVLISLVLLRSRSRGEWRV